MAGGNLGDHTVCFGKKLLHGAVGEGSQGEHDFGVACRGAEGLFAKVYTDECGLAEVVVVGIGFAVQIIEVLNDFGNCHTGIDAFFGCGSVSVATGKVVNNS